LKIDAHQHFWKYNAVEYPWIDDAMKVIRRDFLPEDLLGEIGRVGVEGVLSVQARQTVAETQWLLDIADNHDFIRGIVGWMELVSPGIATDLERFAGNKALKAVRHVVQDERDMDFLLRHDFNRGVGLLTEFGLAYDILIVEHQLPIAIEFVDRHPEQRFVLDHIGKPSVVGGELSSWQQNIRKLAERPNVYCKVSGMVTQINYKVWSEAQLRTYFDGVLEAFGAERCMFGSDWPVCLVACDYARWHRIVSGWVAALSTYEQERILGGTAMEAYNL
jgi:L-fuconolactonase